MKKELKKNKKPRELAAKIVEAVNNTKNKYDAIEAVEKILMEEKKDEK